VISVTAQRESGILKRRRATPVPAWVLIVGRGLVAFFTAAATATALIAIGVLAYGARVPERTIPAIVLAVAVAVGALSFGALSMRWSQRSDPPTPRSPLCSS
jgi:ABC-2 type transport system permease protein